MGSNQYDQCPYKKGKFGHRDMHTERTPCKHQDRDQGDVSTSQGKPKVACKPSGARERPGIASSSQLAEGTNSADTSVSDFKPLDL